MASKHHFQIQGIYQNWLPIVECLTFRAFLHIQRSKISSGGFRLWYFIPLRLVDRDGWGFDFLVFSAGKNLKKNLVSILKGRFSKLRPIKGGLGGIFFKNLTKKNPQGKKKKKKNPCSQDWP